jgi:hypothetical protein
MEKIITNIIHKNPLKVEDVKQPEQMLNPVTYEITNSELWEDGLYLYPNLLDKDLKINMAVEVKDGKVVRVYESKL